jgi:hypothetical protein
VVARCCWRAGWRPAGACGGVASQSKKPPLEPAWLAVVVCAYANAEMATASAARRYLFIVSLPRVFLCGHGSACATIERRSATNRPTGFVNALTVQGISQ